ncbi:TonB-dependent siderophore receptor [Thioclava sp. GXIMD4215]|uniref:TonB-dependent siderophore receptor n=1 Tax=Thioclava sp. GXIMD4215 TaxID=3131928 RepID=UPI00311AE57E
MTMFYHSTAKALLAGTALWACPLWAQEDPPIPLDGISVYAADEGAEIDGYHSLAISSATRTSTPLRATPQSVQVIPSQMLADQLPARLAEVLYNASGAQGSVALQTPAFESTLLRGFPAEIYSDGITNYINAGDANALAGIERVDVLKGPNAILYGGGTGTPLGGIVNLVTKKPQPDRFATAALTLGSEALIAPSFDVNARLGQTALFRMTGSAARSGAQTDVLETRRYAFSPALTLGYGGATQLTVQGYLSRWQQQEYQGLPATGTVTGGFALDRDLFIGDPDIPESTTSTRKLTFTLDHSFNETWSARGQFRIGRTRVEQITQIILSNVPDAGDSRWSLYNSYVPGEQTEYNFNASVEGHLSTGAVDHTLLLGVDYARIKDYSLMYMDYAGSVDLTDPVAWPAWTMPASLAMGEGHGRYTTAGAYAQLQSDVGAWHLLGGVRFGYLQTVYESEGYGRRDSLQQARLLPRIGAVWDLAPQVSAFASYSEGMKANAFYFYSDMPEPEYSRQAELGVKFDQGAWSGSVAAFQIQRRNVPVTDPDDPLMLSSITEGQQRSRGVEADLVWQSEGPWRLVANYAYTAAVLTADIPNGARAGSSLAGVPRHSGGLWLTYDPRDPAGEGWQAGVGLHAASSAYIDLENLYKTGGYATVNASGSYTRNGMTYALAIKNLLNRDYDLPFWKYLDGRVAPGPERQVLLTISKTF